jgi:hypothetical protein
LCLSQVNGSHASGVYNKQGVWHGGSFADTFLKDFAISNRAADMTNPRMSTWMRASDLNNSATRTLGHLLIEWGALRDISGAVSLKRKRGTIFNPISGDEGGEYGKLCAEASQIGVSRRHILSSLCT